MHFPQDPSPKKQGIYSTALVYRVHGSRASHSLGVTYGINSYRVLRNSVRNKQGRLKETDGGGIRSSIEMGKKREGGGKERNRKEENSGEEGKGEGKERGEEQGRGEEG